MSQRALGRQFEPVKSGTWSGSGEHYDVFEGEMSPEHLPRSDFDHEFSSRANPQYRSERLQRTIDMTEKTGRINQPVDLMYGSTHQRYGKDWGGSDPKYDE